MGILTLPSVWSGREPSQIVVALLEVITRILRLDFAYAVLRPPHSEVMETIRFADLRVSPDEVQAARRALNHWLSSSPPTRSSVLRGFGDDCKFAVVSLGAQEHIGEIVAGSIRPEFPTERDRFLLGVAANYAGIALQDTILRTERQALAGMDSDLARRAELAELEKLHASLTPREREVLPFVVAGFLSKQTAAELGVSEITIRVHRGQIMRKMRAKSLAELIRMADKLGIPISPDLGSPKR